VIVKTDQRRDMIHAVEMTHLRRRMYYA